MMIVPFLEWMKKEGLADPSDIPKDDIDGFNTRFRIQKCVVEASRIRQFM